MTDPAPSSAVRTTRVPRRFADMDALAHVNNVRYLDYLGHGRGEWLRAHDLATDAPVRAHRLAFDAPMLFGRADAEVRTWPVGVEDGRVRLAQDVATYGHHGDEERTVHLRAETWVEADRPERLDLATGEGHAWREVPADERTHRHVHAADVRRRDLGPRGTVRDDAVVEWFQEARVRYFMDLHQIGEQWGQVVIARTDVALERDASAGDVGEVRSWIARVGGSSFTVRADLVAAHGGVLARSTVVAVHVDAGTGRPAPLADAHRARLEGELAG